MSLRGDKESTKDIDLIFGTEEDAVEEKEATEKKVVMIPESSIKYIIITDGEVAIIMQPKGRTQTPLPVSAIE